VAVISASVTSGYGPLIVDFSGQGSYDPDGTISAYYWSFGDGTTSTQANPSKTYNTPGNYNAELTVTDNSGGTSSTTVGITVVQKPTVAIFVDTIAMTLVKSGKNASARATVTVYDSNGQPRPNVAVYGSWSGLVGGNVSGTTNAYGQVVFTSGSSKRSGWFTFTVSNLSAGGYTYDATLNKETRDSIYFN
jgi:PKD repeat protein